MTKNKKPTLMEVKTVLTNVIMQINDMDQHLHKMDSAVFNYIKFKGDEKSFLKWMTKLTEEKTKNAKANGASPKGDKQPKGEK